jgi:hypothetical protein
MNLGNPAVQLRLHAGRRVVSVPLFDIAIADTHGDAAIRHTPAPATTNDRPPGNHEAHELARVGAGCGTAMSPGPRDGR